MSDVRPKEILSLDESPRLYAEWEKSIVDFSRSWVTKEQCMSDMVDICGKRFADGASLTFCRDAVIELIMEGFPQTERLLMRESDAYAGRKFKGKRTVEQEENMTKRTPIQNKASRIFRDIMNALGFEKYLTTEQLKEMAISSANRSAERRSCLTTLPLTPSSNTCTNLDEQFSCVSLTEKEGYEFEVVTTFMLILSTHNRDS